MKGFDPKFADFPDYIIGITKEIWEDRGWELLAIYHSHPDSVAYPSKRDIGIAYWPDSTEPIYRGTYFIICSLEDTAAPVIRAFLFDDDGVHEAAVQIDG